MVFRMILFLAALLSGCALAVAACSSGTSAPSGAEQNTIEFHYFYDHVDALLQEQGPDAAVEYIEKSVHVGGIFSDEGETFTITDMALSVSGRGWVIGDDTPPIRIRFGQHEHEVSLWLDRSGEIPGKIIVLYLSYH